MSTSPKLKQNAQFKISEYFMGRSELPLQTQLMEDKFDSEMLNHLQKQKKIKESLKRKFFYDPKYSHIAVSIPLSFTLDADLDKIKRQSSKRRQLANKKIPIHKSVDVRRAKRYDAVDFQAKGVSFLHTKNPQIVSLSLQLNKTILAPDAKESRSRARAKILTLSQRHKAEQRAYRNERQQFMIKTTDSQSRYTDVCTRQNKEQEIFCVPRDFGYGSYLRHKTKKGVSRTARERYVPEQDSLVAKFQAVVLNQARHSVQSKHRLQKTFADINKDLNRLSIRTRG